MKKYILVLLVACSIFLSAAPAFAKTGGPTGGEPPGWSQVNPGNGGTGPGKSG